MRQKAQNQKLYGFNDFIKKKTPKIFLGLVFTMFFATSMHAQFVHPGLSHKLSDLDRMKYQVNAGIEPWKSSFEDLNSNSDASYNYSVYGATYIDPEGTTYSYNSLSAMQKDAQAAYYNAIEWYVTGDTRHAEKAIDVFRAWSTIRNIANDVIPLNPELSLGFMLGQKAS